MLLFMENCEKSFFAPGGLWKWCYLNFQKTCFFWQIRVFTKYHRFNATKWPQMPQKLIRTISHGSWHTLDTLNHGLEPFYCFITLFASRVASTLASPWPLICHPGSKSVILGHYESYLTHLEWIIQAQTLLFLLQRYYQIGLFIAKGCVHACTHVRG